MEICDPIEKKQVVHLILAEGGTNCEIVRHMPKDCVPSKENDHPIMPQKATFKELLLSQNHSMAALEDTIKKTVSFLKNTTLDFQINNSYLEQYFNHFVGFFKIPKKKTWCENVFEVCCSKLP